MTLPAYAEEVAVGNGVVVAFDFSFKITSSSELTVIIEDTLSGAIETLPSNEYSVSGVGDDDGGMVTLLNTIPAATDRVIITSSTPYTQGVDLLNQSGFNASVVEGALDKLARQIQQVAVEVARSVRGPAGEEWDSILGPEARANSFLGFDTDGDLELVVGAPDSPPATADIASQAQAEAGAINTKFMTPLRTAQAILAQVPDIVVDFLHERSVWDFALPGVQIDDGVTDARPAFLLALQWALTNKGCITVPTPAVKYLVSSVISLIDYVAAADEINPVVFGIKGQMRMGSRIFIPASNTTGFFFIDFTGANKHFIAQFDDFYCQVEPAVRETSIMACRSSAGGATDGYQEIWTRVAVRATTGDAAISRKKVIDVTGTYRPVFRDCHFEGADQITPAVQSIANITKANPAVVTYTPSAGGGDVYTDGDQILITGVIDMVEVNDLVYTVAGYNSAAHTFQLLGVNSTAYTDYLPGGGGSISLDNAAQFRCERIVDVTQCYRPIFWGNFIRSGKTGISHIAGGQEGGIYQGNVVTTTKTALRIQHSSLSTKPITAISKANPGVVTYTAVVQDITGISNANPAVVTYSGADTYANGDRVLLTGVVGTTEVNGLSFTVAGVNTGANTFQLSGIDSTAYGVYVSGGKITENGYANDDHVFLMDIAGMHLLTDREFIAKNVTDTNFRLTDPITGTNINTTNLATYTGGGTVHALNSTQQPAHSAMDNVFTARDVGMDLSGIVGCDFHHNDCSSGSRTPYFGGQAMGVWLHNYREVELDGHLFSSAIVNGIDILVDGRVTGADALILGGHHGSSNAQSAIKILAGSSRTVIVHPNIIDANYTLPIDDQTSGTDAGTSIVRWGGANKERHIISFKAGNAAINPLVELTRYSDSAADGDKLVSLQWKGNNDAATPEEVIYGAIEGRADDVSDGTEDGGLDGYSMIAGTKTLAWSYGGGFAMSNAARMGLGSMNVTVAGYYVAGVKVMGAQGAAVADATDAASVIARLNDLLARARAHGLIAT